MGRSSRGFESQSICFLTFCVLFGALGAGSSGCGRPAPAPPGFLQVGLDTAPLNLDPRFASDATASQIGELLFAGLTRVDDSGRRVADLAATWEQPDATTYVFHLRPGLRFSDGSGMEASDVEATYAAVLDPDGRSPKRASLGMLRAVEVVDALTVRFHLQAPFAPFLTATGLGILPRHQLAPGSSPPGPLPRPIGCGAFRLQTTPDPDRITLERNPFAAVPAKLPGIVFRVIPDAITRLLELRRGSLELVQSGIEPDALPWLQDQAQLQVQTTAAAAFQYLGLNLQRPPLNDRQVRRALAHAIDRNAITGTVLEGLARPAAGLLPPGHWAHLPNTPAHAYDPARARRLLDRAGWRDPDGDGPAPRFRLELKTTTVELRRRLAEVLQAQLAQIGIAVDIRSYEWATFYNDIRRGNFEIYSLAWIGIEDPDLYYLSLHSSQGPPEGMNRGGFADAKVDHLSTTARHELDPQRRRHLYAALQVRAARQLPVIPLWWPYNAAALQRHVHGYRLTANGGYGSLAEIELGHSE